jgi:transcriptional regulator with XRE-family HTH domain
LSQAQIENRSGLQRAYLSRVENGHTVPTIDTLEKWATALGVPIYLLFYDGAEPPKSSELRVWKSPDEAAWGTSGQDAEYLKQLRRCLRKLDEPNRRLILQMTSRLARRAQKSAAAER